MRTDLSCGAFYTMALVGIGLTWDGAQLDLSRRQQRLKEKNDAISNFIAFVANRFNCNVYLPELEETAVKAVLDGCNGDIAENIGRLRWR